MDRENLSSSLRSKATLDATRYLQEMNNHPFQSSEYMYYKGLYDGYSNAMVRAREAINEEL